MDLVPVFDYDIAQINTSTPAPPNEYHKAAKADGALVGWHRDSFSFVCVVMLSDTRQMVGGETALRMGNGEVKKIRGPSKVIRDYVIYCKNSQLSGLRCNHPRPLHRSPSPPNIRRHRAHHDGLLIPSTLALDPRRQRSPHRSTHLKPRRSVRPGPRISAGECRGEDQGHVEGG